MTVQLYLAPAAGGKTAYILDRLRKTANSFQTSPRVLVPTHLQARAFRRRLAQAGGALGVRVLTFDQVYAACLNVANAAYTELSEAVQYRLIRALFDAVPLAHYTSLAGRPGFVQTLQALFAEWKAARIWPDALAEAVQGWPDRPDLHDLARLYTAYQAHLQEQRWADRAGLGWLAVEALENPAFILPGDWSLLAVDGFDSLTSVQLALLKALSARVPEMIVTLTGAVDGEHRDLVHKRFLETRAQIEEKLNVEAQPLPAPVSHHAPALAALENGLFVSGAKSTPNDGAIDLIKAPDRAGEVRAALRWLKARLHQDGMRPGEVALLARDVAPYRPFVQQTAAEFALPIHLVDGLPLRANPAVAALLDLLQLALPADGMQPEPTLPYRPLIEAWRSPYLDWSALPEPGAGEAVGIAPGDADQLDAVARWGRVVGGLGQWRAALAALIEIGPSSSDGDEERGRPANLPAGDAAQALAARFERFVRRLTPPGDLHTYRGFAGWLETLIGPDPADADDDTGGEPTSLQVVRCARQTVASVAERDIAALQALKDVLRGLVWAEDALGVTAISFTEFVAELAGAIEAVSYQLPVHPDQQEILFADVVQARGLAFRAVALLGLGEGEFPALLREDPFLRDIDRRRLCATFGPVLKPSTDSAEAEYFYETITRPRERLLLTRPRLADNGAPWPASPFWEELRRLVEVDPLMLKSEQVPAPAQAASWPELLESLAAHPSTELAAWVREKQPARSEALSAGAHIFELRARGRPCSEAGSVFAGSVYNGDLSAAADDFAIRFGPNRAWSASRLESYRACPMLFWVAYVLGVEPREPPAEGLDVRQVGNLYHRILEQLYRAAPPPTDLETLLALLPAVAGAVLDRAPQEEGFRATRWWQQTRVEIVEQLRRTLIALEGERGDWTPALFEASFGREGHPPLVVRRDNDYFTVRGLIDRIDRAPDGRVRVIDYKTGGPAPFSKGAVREGKKLQLGLYALAARDALGLGQPVEGFYWHVRHAQASPFTLSGFDGGPEQAMATVVEHAWAAVNGARAGHFAPHPPDGGCPAYCPARGFCWQWRSGYGG